jgi:hypothetical protein
VLVCSHGFPWLEGSLLLGLLPSSGGQALPCERTSSTVTIILADAATAVALDLDLLGVSEVRKSSMHKYLVECISSSIAGVLRLVFVQGLVDSGALLERARVANPAL